MIMIAIYCISILLIFLYILLIACFIRSWNSLPSYDLFSPGKTTVTVIIPFRNEERNMQSIVRALEKQTYPLHQWKVLFVDDHSSDKSVEVLSSCLINMPNAGLISTPSAMHGKKSALQYAAERTGSELLLFTDADCTMGEDWICSMVSFYENKRPFFISGPVILEAGDSFFSKFQSLEFLSLAGSSAASFACGNPIMANGANIAVNREIYLESIDEQVNATPSGDDVFLLLYIKKNYPGKLCYLKSSSAIVTTKPATDMRSFLNQRLRWVSKARYYRDSSVILTAILVFMLNSCIIACLIAGFFRAEFFIPCAIMIPGKSIIDFIFLRKISEFTGQVKILRIFAFSELVYFLYVVIAGLFGNIMSVKWKERKIKI